MATSPNPLMGWLPQSGTNQPQQPGLNLPGAPPSLGPTSGPAASKTGGALNPYGSGTLGGGALGSNLAQTNLIGGEQRNALINPFAQNMFGMAQPAGNFFNQLMNLGSPYYQQQQQASFTQGNQQNQNAAAQARQQLASQGYGSTPSGANAAMIGGMAQGGAQSLSEQFLQNLFNNEQLQLAGAQGLGSLAQLFNPAQLTGQQTTPNINQAQNTFAQDVGALGGLFGALKPSGGG